MSHHSQKRTKTTFINQMSHRMPILADVLQFQGQLHTARVSNLVQDLITPKVSPSILKPSDWSICFLNWDESMMMIYILNKITSSVRIQVLDTILLCEGVKSNEQNFLHCYPPSWSKCASPSSLWPCVHIGVSQLSSYVLILYKHTTPQNRTIVEGQRSDGCQQNWKPLITYK